MILFSNLGEIDTRLITTMGVNVKDNDSPIGYFGTGMKYAIAVLLREKQEIEIWSGLTHMSFKTTAENIRGKDFDFIVMTMDGKETESKDVTLGFTTELGKNWTLENAYRELHCNCTDEKGVGGQQLYDNLHTIIAESDTTKILVKGDKFDLVHATRDNFLLNTETKTLLVSSDRCDIYAGRHDTIFYRGIAVRKAVNAAFTYNLKSALILTEDRTLRFPMDADSHIAMTLGMNASAEVIREAIFNKGGYEHEFYPHEWGVPSETWYKTVQKCIEEDSLNVSDHVFKLFFQKEGNELKYQFFVPTEEQQRELDTAVAFCQSIGLDPCEYKIRPVESLGRNIYARAERNTIWLTRSCWTDDQLVEALLEEYIHLHFKVDDYSREMQNTLFKQIIRLGKRVQKATPI